jgi:F0F1-type ATP synthase membrane subunit c/vacuolar-type H+-ATPase subunit K
MTHTLFLTDTSPPVNTRGAHHHTAVTLVGITTTGSATRRCPAARAMTPTATIPATSTPTPSPIFSSDVSVFDSPDDDGVIGAGVGAAVGAVGLCVGTAVGVSVGEHVPATQSQRETPVELIPATPSK